MISETQRRKVHILAKPHGTKLKISLEKGGRGFVLSDHTGSEIAHSLSDNSLSKWAFDYGGAFEVEFSYDLIEGDMAR